MRCRSGVDQDRGLGAVQRLSGSLLGLALAACLASGGALADELAVYRAAGPDAALFDQYDNDGYSLAVSRGSDGSLSLTVRVSASPLQSRTPFPPRAPEAGPTPSPERDAWASAHASGARTQAEAVERILSGIASEVRYDPDRHRRQDPGAVFATRRAYCVGFAELSVDLLRRAGISARTVQGILRTPADAAGYEAAIGGVYHRWVEIYYPDRGYVFSDPSASINGVDARYVPFGRRALERPAHLTLTRLESSGELSFPVWKVGEVSLRVRPTATDAPASSRGSGKY
jgi:transglutaminase-like putative cysteine protease